MTLPLTYGCFTVTLRPERALALPPYPGSMFRGAFGWALQRVVCVTRTHDCPPCLLKERCVFPYVFDTPPPAGTRIMRKYPSAPHPFVLEPPFPGGVSVAAGEPVRLGLTVIGKALQYLPYLVFAFERLGRTGLGPGRVRCGVVTLEGALDGHAYVLYDAADRSLRATEPFTQVASLALGPSEPPGTKGETERLRVEFLTPVRIVFEERLADSLEFHVLVRSLLRRLAHLSYFHCGGDPLTVAFREWIERAKHVRTVSHSLRWYDWERYSGRQQTRMSLGGLLGSIAYEGELTPFLPLLRAGEALHVGKGASFGLGRYRLEEAGLVSPPDPG
jgi:hypothetical protein